MAKLVKDTIKETELLLKKNKVNKFEEFSEKPLMMLLVKVNEKGFCVHYMKEDQKIKVLKVQLKNGFESFGFYF